jgi:hypothetical protein
VVSTFFSGKCIEEDFSPLLLVTPLRNWKDDLLWLPEFLWKLWLMRVSTENAPTPAGYRTPSMIGLAKEMEHQTLI